MEIYTALRRSSLKKDNSKFTLAIGVLLALYAMYKRDYIFVLIGAVLAFIGLYTKDVIIDENGITTEYHAVIYNKSIRYPLSEFSELRVQRNLGSEMVIGFVRKGMSTNCLFTLLDGEAIIRLMKENNPKIKVVEVISKRRPKF